MWTIVFPTTVFWVAVAAIAAFSRSPLAQVLTFSGGCVIEAALVHLLTQGSAHRARVASSVAAATWTLFALAFATYGFTFLSVVGLFAGIATLLALAFTFEDDRYVVGGLLPATYFIADRLAGTARQMRFDIHRSGEIAAVVNYCTSTFSWFTFDATIVSIVGLAALFSWVFRRLGFIGPPLESSSRRTVFFAVVAVALAAGLAIKAVVGSAFSVVSGVLTGAAYSFISRPSTLAANRVTSIAVIGALTLLAAFFGAGHGWVSWHYWQLDNWCR